MAMIPYVPSVSMPSAFLGKSALAMQGGLSLACCWPGSDEAVVS